MSAEGDCSSPTDGTTPLPVANRPGLAALNYRVGTHASFFESMKARLATFVPGDASASGQGTAAPLAALTTRDPSDPAIAMLEAWATVADVLTFYQERIANEGFLRTAVEQRSVQWIAALVGHAVRPGVAASAHLAFTVGDPGGDVAVPIPAGLRVQSVPDPGSLPQTFETSEAIDAKASWNALKPRQGRLQRPSADAAALYFKGVSTNLKPNDPLLLVTNGQAAKGPLPRVESVDPQFSTGVTKVTLQRPVASQGVTLAPPRIPLASNEPLLASLRLPPARQPRSAANLVQRYSTTFGPNAEGVPQLLGAFHPDLSAKINAAVSHAQTTPVAPVEVYAFRTRAAPFGSSAALQPVFDGEGKLLTYQEWTLSKPDTAAFPDDKFSIQLEIIESDRAFAAPNFQFTATVLIGGHQLPVGRCTLPATTIDIVDAAVNEHVVVTVPDRAAARRQRSDRYEFALRTRGAKVEVTIQSPKSTVTTSAVGCDPVECTISSGESTTGAQRELMTITGTTRGASLKTIETEVANVISLDTVYDRVAPASWIVIERPDKPEGPIVTSVNKVTNGSRPDYGLSGRTSSIEIKGEWLGPRVNPGGASVGKEDFAKVIRGTTVFAESELLTLDNTPIPEPVGGAVLELEGVHSGLEPGRLLIVAGERVDIPGTKGIKDAELVMLASVEHVPASDVPGDAVHTALTLASPLAYQYDRATVTLYGNVLHATHGESRSESLGSGDGTQASPQFALHQAPLTYVSAATPSGIASTLQVRVNDVLWHEAESLVGLGPTDRRYVTQETDDGTTIVVFGDGRQGARLPTGSDNVKARYRSGIGRAGNVAAGKINSLLMRPGGVNAVSNPQAASGGADRESPDEIRSNAPIAAMALDRLVSVQDHADFSRNFAGVGKAVAERLAVGRHQSVVVSVAGADEAPIDPASDLCTNLLAALQNFGDPHQSIQVMPAEAVLLIVAAKVRVDPDWEWASVYPAVLAALLATFGYARRNIGQDVVLSEVIATIQSVAGVAFVDVDRLDTTTVATLPADLARLADANPPRTRPASRVRALPARRGHHGSALLPAQVVYLSDRAPGLVNLSELN